MWWWRPGGERRQREATGVGLGAAWGSPDIGSDHGGAGETRWRVMLQLTGWVSAPGDQTSVSCNQPLAHE